jgi:hypothetical protein
LDHGCCESKPIQQLLSHPVWLGKFAHETGGLHLDGSLPEGFTPRKAHARTLYVRGPPPASCFRGNRAT